jgi:hypothetical protein
MKKNPSIIGPDAEFVASIRKAILNSLASAPILNLLRPFGYDTEGLIEGRVLYEAAASKMEKSADAARAAAGASDFVEETWSDALKAYESLAKVARKSFAKNKAALELLGLKGAAPRKPLAIRNSARKLFNTSQYTPDIMIQFAKKGYNEAKLSRERAKFAEYDHAVEMQLREKSACERAQAEEEMIFGDLREWSACFLQVARVALQRNSEFLTRLGLKSRTAKRKKTCPGGLRKLTPSRRSRRAA